MELTEEDPFAHEMNITSTLSGATAVSTTTVTRTETETRKSTKIPILVEAIEPKRRGHPRKVQKKSGRSHEKDLHTGPREDCDADGEGHGKAEEGKRSG